MVRGVLVKWGIVKLFLATETYNHLCLTNRNSRVEHSLHAGAAPSWIRACLIVCFFFCCPWQCSQLLCCFPHLWALESKRNGGFQSWDIAKEEWETWSVLLLCFSHHTQKHDSTPAFIVAPTRASLDFPSPCLSCAAVTWNSEGNLLTTELVTHPGAFSSAESWSAYLDSDTVSYLSGKIQLQSSSSHRKWERGLEKGRPPEIARSGICLRCTVSAPCFGCPEGVLEVT